MELVLFFLIAVLTAAAAIGAVAFRNPLYCAISLLTLGACSALLLVHLQAPFLGVAQMLVSTGVVLVLLLSAISVMNLRTGKYAEPLRRGTRSAALVLGVVLLAHLAWRLVFYPVGIGAEQEITGSTVALGQIVFTRFALPLEITALVLLAAVVALLVLAGQERVQVEGE